MGQLKDKKIIQSRIWHDPNAAPIPDYDYDYSYPISVYEAIKRNTDDNSTNLRDELDSIYRLINDKQPIVEAGIPGNLMTWSGVRGSIGTVELLKSINSDPISRSYQKVVSERAIGDALDTKVPMSKFATHVNDAVIHVTDVERSRWNAMAPMSTLHSHISNAGMHITEVERGIWNNKADQSIVDNHIYDLNNPHRTTAHQVGAYSRQEIDDMFENLRESFFNYLNIYWDERQNKAELTEYHASNWNPNFVLEYDDELPEVTSEEATYFALKPATDYQINESQDCVIYIKRPGMIWQEVGFCAMKSGDLVLRYPDTGMYVWVQGRFNSLFGNGGINSDDGDGSTTVINSNMMWRPVYNEETGEISWIKSKESEPPAPHKIKGENGYTPIKGVDYFDGENGVGVPIGGKSGEILVKITDSNYDTAWRSAMEVLSDIIISGGGLPDGSVNWEMIAGRPEWYNELGDNENGFITQRAATRQFEILSSTINELTEKIIGNGGIDSVKGEIYDHVNDYNNPHRITAAQIGAIPVGTFTDHTQNFDNPHNVNAHQIGLGNVNNTSDMDKPISNAVQEALDNILDKIGTVTGDIDLINFIDDVKWDGKTTTLSFMYKDDTQKDVLIPITEIFTSITFDKTYGDLVIALPDNTEHRINISSMIKLYTGEISDNIQVEVFDDFSIKATVLPGSISEEEIKRSIHLPGSPTTTTQPVTDRSSRIATTEFTRKQVVDNLISYETDRPLSANMGRILNQQKVDVDDIMEIINDLEGIDVIDHLESTNSLASLSANMGRMLDLTKAPRVHTSPSASTFGRATISLFGHAKASDVDPLMDGTVFRGTDDGNFARGDHRHPTDISRAPTHFPDITHNIYELTGEPRAVIAPDDSNDNRIATTSWIRRNAVGVQYGDCETEGANNVKMVTLRSDFMEDPVFMRQTGSTVVVSFAEDDKSSDDVYMDVHGTGAAMVIYGGKPIVNNMLKANYTYTFTFDGINWRLENPTAIHTLPDSDNSSSIVSSEWVRRNIIGVMNGECSTAGGNPNKTVILRSTFMDPVVFTRQIGTAVAVTFANEDHSGDSPTTLNVNGTGAATILFAGGPISTGMIGKNHTHLFIFDGENWRLINPVPGTGIGGPGGINIGPGSPVDDDEEDTEPVMIINQLTGHNGITTVGVDGSDSMMQMSIAESDTTELADENGQVYKLWVTINFTPKAGDVQVTLSEDEGAWAARMGDGSLIRVNNPNVINVTNTNCVVEFDMDNPYPSNSPCQLVYRTNKAWINIKEI